MNQSEFDAGWNYAELTAKNGFNLQTVLSGLTKVSEDYYNGYKSYTHHFEQERIRDEATRPNIRRVGSPVRS